MPPTGRRRRNKDAEQRVDAEVAEVTTPSRKRRRVNGSNNAATTTAAARTARRASAESDATIEHQDEDENEMDSAQEYRDAEAIIQRLRTAHYQVGVSIDHNNSIVPPNEQAFAKIAGRNWTFYVKKTSVVIGRPNNKTKRESGDATSTPVTTDDSFMVNIDLGPDQQISRVHAEIAYEPEEQKWVIHCNGRNGLHLDDMRLERGQNCLMRSGMVISILGTQMIFILPDQVPEIHPVIRRTLLEENDEEDQKYEPGDTFPKGTNVRFGGQASSAYKLGGSTRPAGGSGTQAAHALAALSTSHPQPPGTPIARPQPPQPKSKNSPAYGGKGLMIESTEEIDYSADSAKDIKPPHSYAQMIGQAILSREGENATLAQIYEFIKDHYAYFRHGGGGWQNSIRHNLSLSKHFEKIPRRTDEPGKGMKWQIVPEFREEYMKKNFHENRRAQRRLDSSGPNSPATGLGPGLQTERLVGALNTDMSRVKHHSGSPTPPRHTYPEQNESFTPDRGPRNIGPLPAPLPSTNGGASMSATSELVTPTYERNNPLASQQTYSAGSRHGDGMRNSIAESPPTLTGTAYDAASNNNVFTPLPARQAPKPHLLSTIKPPSFYAKELFSSPAPFWKFAEIPGSTPLRPMADLSPEKFARPAPIDDEGKTDQTEPADDDPVHKKEDVDDDETKVFRSEADEEAEAEAAAIDDNEADIGADAEAEFEIPPPSSPLGNKANEDALDESPTRTISRPVSRREPGPTLNGLDKAPKLGPPPAQPKFSLSTGTLNAPSFKMYQRVNGEMDDDDDGGGIDLSKMNFQKIGQYHRVMNSSRPTPR